MTRITPVFDAGNSLLNQLMRRDPLRCASLSEYAEATGLPISEVVTHLGPMLDSGAAALETHAGEVFVLTGADGRRRGAATTEPNLWEVIRRHANVADSYRRWRLLRALSRAGWRVEPDVTETMTGVAPVRHVPSAGLRISENLIPLLADITPAAMQMPDGPLSDWAAARLPVVSIVCPPRQLDKFITACRVFFVAHRQTRLQVVILEEPSYSAVVLDSTDPRVVATDINRLVIGGRPETM